MPEVRCDICGFLIRKGELMTIKNGLSAYHEYCYLQDLNNDKELDYAKTKKGEQRNSYVSRAIKEIKGEGLSQKAAVGKAEGMADYYMKKHRKTNPHAIYD